MRLIKKCYDGSTMPYMYGADPTYYATLPQNDLMDEETKQSLAKANAKARMFSLLPFLGAGTSVGRFLTSLTQPSTYIQKVASLISPIKEMQAAAYVSPWADIVANSVYAGKSLASTFKSLGNIIYDDKADVNNEIVDLASSSIGAFGIPFSYLKYGIMSPASKRLKAFAGLDVNRPAFIAGAPLSGNVEVTQAVLGPNGTPLTYKDILSPENLQLIRKYGRPDNPHVYFARYFNLKNKGLKSTIQGTSVAGDIRYPGYGTVNVSDQSITMHEVGGHGTQNRKNLKPYSNFLKKYKDLIKKYEAIFDKKDSVLPQELRATAIELLPENIPYGDPDRLLQSIQFKNGYAYDWVKFFNDPRVKSEPQFNQMRTDFLNLIFSE